MNETQTERASCRFLVQKSEGAEKYTIKVQACHDGLSVLKNAVLGFDLLSSVSAEQAKKIADTLERKRLATFRDDGGFTSAVQGKVGKPLAAMCRILGFIFLNSGASGSKLASSCLLLLLPLRSTRFLCCPNTSESSSRNLTFSTDRSNYASFSGASLPLSSRHPVYVQPLTSACGLFGSV
jgi:hypothetical protein